MVIAIFFGKHFNNNNRMTDILNIMLPVGIAWSCSSGKWSSIIQKFYTLSSWQQIRMQVEWSFIKNQICTDVELETGNGQAINKRT